MHHPGVRSQRCSPIVVVAVSIASILLTACGPEKRPQAKSVALAELEKTYGRILTAGNHPTGDQGGTGDRLGLFRDAAGTIWGLPLIIASDGEVLGCVPSEVKELEITDTYPAGATIMGVANEPTGHRGGTGKLELMLRDIRGNVRFQTVKGGHTARGSICWAQEPPGPPQKLGYYRIAPTPGNK